MAFPQVATVTVTVDESGDGTGYTDNIRGSILAVQYVKDDYADTADFTISTEESLQNVWVDTNITASETVYPKILNDGTTGADLTGVYDHIRAYNEKVVVRVAGGGNATSGTFKVYYE